jgi:hypothetical protein
LKTAISLRAKLVGLLTSAETSSDFRFDELARALKKRGLNVFTRETFAQLCRDEGLLSELARAPDPFLSIAIRSFLGPASDIVGALPENTLLLTDSFRQRYLRSDLDWQRDIRPVVEIFLREKVKQSAQLRLILDAHASVAFLAGSVLDRQASFLTPRMSVRPFRCHRPRARRAILHGLSAPVRKRRGGPEITVVISVAQSAQAAARAYCGASLPQIGNMISFELPGGPNQQGVRGGGHAAVLAEAISNYLRHSRGNDLTAIAHIFAAAPNALLFYLGQQHQAVAPCVVYEFDFDRGGNKSYQPSMVID